VSSAKSFVKPEKLPPIVSTAKFHSQRAFLQIMVWMRKDGKMDPKDWAGNVKMTFCCQLWQTRNQLLIGYWRSLIVTVPQVVAILDVVAGSTVFHVLPHVDPTKLSHATTHIMNLQQTFPLMRMMISFLLWFEPLEPLDRQNTSDNFSFQSKVSHLCL